MFCQSLARLFRPRLSAVLFALGVAFQFALPCRAAPLPIADVGLSVDTFTPPANQPNLAGVRVVSVSGAADSAGMPPDFVIESVEGVPVRTPAQLQSFVAAMRGFTPPREQFHFRGFRSSQLPTYGPRIVLVRLSTPPTDVLDDASLGLRVEPRVYRGTACLEVTQVNSSLSLRRFERIFRAGTTTTATRADLAAYAESRRGQSIKLLVLKPDGTLTQRSVPIPAGSSSSSSSSGGDQRNSNLGLTARFASGKLKLTASPTAGTPGATAGLRNNDEILKADNIPVRDLDDLVVMAADKYSVSLQIERGGTPRTLTLRIPPVLQHLKVDALGVDCDVMPDGGFRIRGFTASHLREAGLVVGDVVRRVQIGNSPFERCHIVNWTTLANNSFTLEYWSTSSNRLRTLRYVR